MYSATEPTTTTQKTAPKSLLDAITCMPRVMVVILCYFFVQFGSQDMFAAFFRSVVVCPEPLPVNGMCPTGSTEKEGACIVVPKSSIDWSGSAHCADKSLVVSTAVAAGGKVHCVANLGVLFSQVCVGTAMLDTLGRKPVMLMGMASSALLCGILWISCHIASNLVTPVIMTCAFIFKLADCFVAASAAMISDLASGDCQLEGQGFAMANIVEHIGIVLAFAVGFPVLSLYLEDYTAIWGVMLMLGCTVTTISAVVLGETMLGMASGESHLLALDTQKAHLPEQLEGGGGGGRGAEPGSLGMVHIMAETSAAVRAVWEDRFLRVCMGCCFLVPCAARGYTSTVGGFGLEVVKLRQQVVSLVGVVQPVAVVLGSYAAAQLLHSLGELATFLLGLLTMMLGLIVSGSGAYFRSYSVICFWLGVLTYGTGHGLIGPSLWKLVSSRAQKNHCGKIFSVKILMDTLGHTCGTYVWSNYIFGNVASGTCMAGLPMFASAALLAVVFLGGVCIRYMYPR